MRAGKEQSEIESANKTEFTYRKWIGDGVLRWVKKYKYFIKVPRDCDEKILEFWYRHVKQQYKYMFQYYIYLKHI